MEHFGNFIRTGLLGALDWFGEQKPETQHFSIGMGGPSPTVSYHSGNRYEISNESFQSPQALPGTFAPAMPNAVWNPGSGMAGPATAPAIWDTAQQKAYPILPVAAQETRGQTEGIPYYRVGRRPLDWKWLDINLGKGAYNDGYFGNIGGDHNLRLEHQHFIGSHNKNFGFIDTGEFEEKGREKEYAYDVPGIGDTKFKAKYMDMARLMVNEQMQNDSEKMKEIMDSFSIEDGSYLINEYHVYFNNCQDYVDKVISTARELAKRNGDTLEIQ